MSDKLSSKWVIREKNLRKSTPRNSTSHVFHCLLPLLCSCLLWKIMCLHLWNECPSGTSFKKQRQGIAASDTLPALLYFFCRRSKSKYYSKSKYFINRLVLIICWSKEKCKLIYSSNGVLPAPIPWNKPTQQHKRNEKFCMSLKDTRILKWSNCYHILKFIKDQDHSFTKRLLLKNLWNVLNWSYILAKAFTSNDIFVPQLPNWTLHSVCLIRMPLLMIFDVSWHPP